jgi:hypothetical protein
MPFQVETYFKKQRIQQYNTNTGSCIVNFAFRNVTSVYRF